MTLGISSYTFGWAVGVPGHPTAKPLDETALLEKAREHNVHLVQFGDNLPLHTFDEGRLTRLAENARSGRIQLEVGTRGLTLERVAEYARVARTVGARLIRLVIDDIGYHPNKDTISGLLRDCLPFLDGLTLAIENHDRFTAAELRGFIDSAGSDRIGVCLDTANSLGAGEGIDTVIATLAPAVVNLHIKDFRIERLPHLMGFTVTGRPAGRGDLKLPKLLKELRRFGRCRTALLELWTPPEAELAETIEKEALWASESIDYLRQFFD